MDLEAALSHKDNCLQAANKAGEKGLPLGVGVTYDYLCRKSWANQSEVCGASFNVSEAAKQFDKVCMHFVRS